MSETVLELESLKHPLENTWSFWLNTNEHTVKDKWMDNLRELTSFDTVEDYWCIYHHTKLPSELQFGQDYSVFKKGIRPSWEDSANRSGGRWFIIMDKRPHDLDRYFLDVVLLMIGENFGDANNAICGVVAHVRDRGRNKITIWTSNKKEIPMLTIGKKIKKTLGINFKMHFYAHNTGNALYTV